MVPVAVLLCPTNGKVIDVRLLAPEKAEYPMLVTLFGITIDVRLLAL